MEFAAAEHDDYEDPRPNTPRAIARAMIIKAASGDVPAFNSIADRMDGKVPQAIVGDDEHDAISIIQRIERIIVKPQHPDSGSVPPAASAS